MVRWLALAATVVACAPQVADVQKEHRPAIDSLVDLARVVAERAEDAPRFLEPRIDDHPVMRPESVHSPHDDLAILYLQDLQALPELGDLRDFTRRTSRLSRCASLVRHNREPLDLINGGGGRETVCKSRMPILLTSCTNFTHLAVVRIHEFVVPALAACAPVLDVDRDFPPTDVPPCAFHPGAIHGDVLLYRLADAALLGGFPVSAHSTSSIPAGQDPMWDLSENMDTQLRVALTKHLHLTETP